MLQQSGQQSVLDQSGVHLFKEDHFCPVCMMNIIFDHCHDELNQEFLGFHLLFKLHSEEIQPVTGIPLQRLFTPRKNTVEDQAESALILSHLLSQLSMCFHTNDLLTFMEHITEEHDDDDYLPVGYLAKLEEERNSYLQEAITADNGIDQQHAFTKYLDMDHIISGARTQGNRAISEFLDMVQKYEPYGVRLNPVRMTFGNKTEVLPNHQSIRCLHIFMYIIQCYEEAHCSQCRPLGELITILRNSIF